MSDVAQIQACFERHCARLPDPVGMRVYAEHLAAGTSLQTLEAAIAGSDEARRVTIWRRITGKVAPETESDRVILLSIKLPTEAVEPSQAPPQQSVELAENELFIRSVYLAILGRHPDDVGMRAYQDAIVNGLPLLQVVADVLASAEARQLNGPSSALKREKQLRDWARRMPLLERLCTALADAAVAKEYLRLWNQRMPRGLPPP